MVLPADIAAVAPPAAGPLQAQFARQVVVEGGLAQEGEASWGRVLPRRRQNIGRAMHGARGEVEGIGITHLRPDNRSPLITVWLDAEKPGFQKHKIAPVAQLPPDPTWLSIPVNNRWS